MRRDAPWVVAIVIFALLAAALVLMATRTGPGLSPDSRAYLMSARFILQGKGISILDGNGDLEPMTHYAPLVSILLAAGGVTGADVTDVARVLNALFFAGSVLLAAAVAWRGTRSRFAAVAAAGLVALSFDLLRTFAMVWSEPPFIFLMLLGILLLGTYVDRRRYAWLIAGSLVIGLAFAARYSGAALVGSCAIALLLHSGGTWRRRIGDTIVFGIIASLPMALWIARNWLLTENAANREISFHPPTIADLRRAVDTMVHWLVPVESGERWAVGIAVVVLLIVYALARLALTPALSRSTGRGGCPHGTLAQLLWFVPTYLAFLLFSLTWVDAHTQLDFRILSPLHAVGLILAAAWLGPMLVMRREPLRSAAAGVLIVLLASQGVRAAAAPFRGKVDLGYSDRIWVESQTLAWIRSLPPETVIYTNMVDAVYFGADRFSTSVPRLRNPLTRKRMPNYEHHLEGMLNRLRTRGGYIVFFKRHRPYLVSEEKLVADLDLQQVFEGADGNAYQLPE